MPELPEVEAICRRLRRRVCGRTILSVQVRRPRTVAPLRAPEFCRKLRRAQILQLERKGKYLVFQLKPYRRWAEDRFLLIHLRMTGALYLDSTEQEIPAGTSVLFQLDGGDRIVFEDPRGLGICRLLRDSEARACLAGIGLEPLSPRFTPEKLWEITRPSRSPIKAFLMDQRHVAGLGNIYSAEALFRARMHPRLPAGRLSREDARRLHQAIVGVLQDALQSALPGYGRPGRFGPQEVFEPQVYARAGQACRDCGGTIRRSVLRSRSTFYCPHCQRWQ